MTASKSSTAPKENEVPPRQGRAVGGGISSREPSLRSAIRIKVPVQVLPSFSLSLQPVKEIRPPWSGFTPQDK